MRKYIALLLALVCVLGLVGCSQQGQQDITTPTQNNEEISRTDIQSESEQDLQFEIVEIRDREKEENLPCDTALEKFYEDEGNEYYFSVIKSQYVIVTYNDGSSEDIVTALNAGRVAMADLDKFNIEYRIEPKAYTSGGYTYEKLSSMPAEELLDLFVQNGLVINDDLKASYTEEELQNLFKENFDLWHTGVSAHSHTTYCDLAEQTKVVYDKIIEPQEPSDNDIIQSDGEPLDIEGISQAKAEEIALEQCKVNYDYIKTEFNSTEKRWYVEFWENMAKDVATQTVLIDTEGNVLGSLYAE